MLADAYALDGPSSSRALYAAWPSTYEGGFVTERGYVYHDTVVDVFVQRCLGGLPPGAAIIDVGCGTGLAGQSLRAYTDLPVDGVDLSPEMLHQASTKRHNGVPTYRHLVEGDLTATLPIGDGTYDAAISVGTFTHGHVGAASLMEVVRIVRPGGCAAVGINALHYEEAGFAEVIGRLSADGRITRGDEVVVPIYAAADPADLDHHARVLIFQVG